MSSISKPLSDMPTHPMTSLTSASSVGSTAHSRLSLGGKGSIVGMFYRAINMALPQGLVCLVTEGVGRGPLNVVVGLPPGIPDMLSLGVRVGDEVSVHKMTLELGSRYQISLDSTIVFSPDANLGVGELEGSKVAANIEVMRTMALEQGNLGGLGGLLALLQPRAGGEAPLLNIFAQAALPSIVKLERAFVSSDGKMLTEAVRGLVGLGPGLTPSSDDALAGIALVCSLCSGSIGEARYAFRLLSDAVVSESRGRTTTLSEEYLAQAAVGRGNEPALRLCKALLTGGRESVELETAHVMAIGETSGTDTILGVILGAMLCTGMKSGLDRREN